MRTKKLKNNKLSLKSIYRLPWAWKLPLLYILGNIVWVGICIILFIVAGDNYGAIDTSSPWPWIVNSTMVIGFLANILVSLFSPLNWLIWKINPCEGDFCFNILPNIPITVIINIVTLFIFGKGIDFIRRKKSNYTQ